ncbi:clip-1 [Pristionchus pacificus]|nr:clip-1 [Pristionchus pacificus]
MLKSAVGCESSLEGSSPSTIVSSSHIGRRVDVEGVGEGTLKYVGGINGKNGLFCGIELDQPNGKHDGTFQGFAYFSCPSLHGIFAKVYKVSLVDLPPSNGSFPQSKTFLLQQQEQQRLSRSALPSLDLRSVYTPSPTHSAMQTSQSSMASSLLNQSYIMNGSWQFGDDMLASNNTYILPGRGLGDDDDLMSVPVRESILDRVLAEIPIATSLVLDESRVGVENLPVIGSPLHSPHVDDMDGMTPMAESMPSLGEEMEEEEDWRATTPIQEDFHSEWSEDRAISGMSEEMIEERDEVEVKREDTKTDKNENGAKGDIPSSSSLSAPLTAKTKRITKKVVEVKKVEERPKKERAPLCPPSTSAKFPVKPKAPSKHQLMMEKLKASMEAEKAEKEKVKKEEKKPRMSLLPPPPPPSTNNINANGKTDENCIPMVVTGSARERTTSSLSSKTPLKQVTNTTSSVPSTSSSSISTTARNIVTRKPRVSLLPPPPSAKKEEKEKSTVVNTSKVNGVKGVSSTSFPTSSFAPKTVSTARRKIELKELEKKKIISEEDKITLTHSNRIIDGLGITLNRMMNEKEKKDSIIEKLEKDKVECQSRVDQLVHRLNETEKTKRMELEELHISNEKAIVSLRDEFGRQSDERESVHLSAINEEKAKYEERIEEMITRHQQTCAILDEKNAESERALEESMKEKKALENALATDHDTKVQTLSQEISSLNTALQMKSSEMKELRLKNQHLTMRVDEIPGKELEISKLRHKITELKLQLDQKHEREKLLVQQNEELRRKERTSSALSESYRTQVDVLQFQLGLNNENESEDGTMNDLNAREGGFDQSAYFTPVRMRKMRGDSDDRPYSYTLPSSARGSQSRNSDDSMTRSVVGMYSANKAHTKMAALDRDVIYAPDQVITNNPRKLSFDEDEKEDKEVIVNGQTDSGIGI